MRGIIGQMNLFLQDGQEHADNKFGKQLTNNHVGKRCKTRIEFNRVAIKNIG